MVGQDTNLSVKSVFIGVKDTPQCDITDQPVHHAAFIYAQIALKNGYMGKRACLKVSIRHPGEGYPAADKIGDSAQIQILNIVGNDIFGIGRSEEHTSELQSRG